LREEVASCHIQIMPDALELIDRLAHDLRTPLTAARLMAEYLGLCLRKGMIPSQHQLDRLVKSLDQLGTHIDAMLECARQMPCKRTKSQAPLSPGSGAVASSRGSTSSSPDVVLGKRTR
jgi:K+-sensing histidine kinase KdpD